MIKGLITFELNMEFTIYVDMMQHSHDYEMLVANYWIIPNRRRMTSAESCS